MSDKETNFISHLTELRQRLIHSLIFLIILFGISYYFSDHIYGFLVEPYAAAVKDDGVERRLIFTALQETRHILKFLSLQLFLLQVHLYLSKFGSLLLQVYITEKAIMPYLILTPILFIRGMLVYYLIMPLAIKFF